MDCPSLPTTGLACVPGRSVRDPPTLEAQECRVHSEVSRRAKRLSGDGGSLRSGPTPELSDAGGPVCPHSQARGPARTRSSDFGSRHIFLSSLYKLARFFV